MKEMKKKINKLSVFCITAIFGCLICSCNPEDDPITPTPVDPTPEPSQTHIYVAGIENPYGDCGPAVCWQDGVMQTLDAGFYAMAKAVCVKGNDIIYGGKDEENHPVIWKNGVKQVLATGNGCVNDLKVVNNKVYAAGELDGQAAYWVDGVVTLLPTDPDALGYTFVGEAIFVNGNDVYVAGNTMAYLDARGAYLWKNSNIQRLSDKVSKACDVCVNNNNVYVVGSESYTEGNIQKAVMWTNGTIQDVQVTTNNGLSSEASSIAIVNGQPYVVATGWVGTAYQGAYKGFVWQNGVTSNLNCSNPQDVFVNNGDVYVVGFDKSDWGNKPMLLKNNSKIALTPSTEGVAFAVYVK